MSFLLGTLDYGREKIRYEVRFLATRRTLGIEVHPDQRVVIRAPFGCPEEVIAAGVRQRAAWISRRLADFERYRPRTPPRQYVSGETHLYLGRQYRLKVCAGDPVGVKLSRGRLHLSVAGSPDPARTRALLRRWYLDRARRVFGEILESRVKHFRGIELPRVIVRAMKSRWGSLSRAGTMTLNASLVRAPRSCIEYVVTHELCHLQHPHHGAPFFRLLRQVMPDWEERKRRLEAMLI